MVEAASVFEWLKRRFSQTPEDGSVQPSLAQVCYWAAYQFVPRMALQKPESFLEGYLTRDQPAKVFFAIISTLARAEPDPVAAEQFHFHHGQLADGRRYLVFEYPEPAPMTLTEAELEAATSLPETPILCPYFSAFIEGSDELPPACYVLGQAMVVGRTTLRRCTLAGHYSLGWGSAPVLEEFVALLPEAHQCQTQGATVLDPSARTSLDEQLLEGLNPVKPGDWP